MLMYGKKPLQYCKVINLQLVKKKKNTGLSTEKKRKKHTCTSPLSHKNNLHKPLGQKQILQDSKYDATEN